MAGDWIKMRTNLDSDPRVFDIAESLGLEDLHVVGLLWKVWSWADQHSIEGNALSVTVARLDKIAGVTGFADALRKVGWLDGRDTSLSFPRFAEHNGQTAKKRAQTADRVKKSRNASSVTEALPEKRRGEKIKPTPSPTRAKSKIESKKPKPLPGDGLDDPQPHPEWADQWRCWVDSWQGREERKFDAIKAQHQLGQLLSRDPAKALRDLEFSLNRWSKRILDSDDDWDIKNAKSPRVSGGKKCELDL